MTILRDSCWRQKELGPQVREASLNGSVEFQSVPSLWKTRENPVFLLAEQVGPAIGVPLFSVFSFCVLLLVSWGINGWDGRGRYPSK